MKKKVLFVASLFLATATFAQDGLTSKKGEAYLPEAGDWSIGFDATALTMFVGNAFNGAGNSTSVIDPSTGTVTNGGTMNSLNAGGWMNGTVGQEIRFKMFKDEKTAIRIRARIGFGSSNSDFLGKYDQDADVTTADDDFVINTKVSDGFSVVLGGGLEKRRGNTRIQGYYGGEIWFAMLAGQTTTVDDGRILSDNFDGGFNSAATARTTETKAGSTLGIGLQGFIGVEWFFAPKVSLGAEYTWGLGFSSTGAGENTSEFWGITAQDAANGITVNSLNEQSQEVGKSGSLSLDTGGQFALNLQFHF